MNIILAYRGDSISCKVADTFWSRFMGLMGKKSVPPGEGLLITPCDSIHMFFMKFAIDVLFLDKNYKIVKIVRGLKPRKFVGTVRNAFQVVELLEGSTPASFLEGVTLQIERK
jgi:uncharacterized protein